MPETTIKHIMKEKLGELISLDIDKITMSEFNTRCQFVDYSHVDTLMKSIEENGYIPKSAVWVNAVKGPDGDIIIYRLVAGRHRYEATKKLGIDEILCQLYYNLTDEEECELDDIDNKLDEHHKPINFLHTAEHYKYLRDVKGWSQRQIAKAKNVSRRTVQWRLQIADLSEEVKVIFRGGDPGRHLHEKYFRELCKLNLIPHQILLCKEIIASRQSEDESHENARNIIFAPAKPMTQKDIEARVEKLLIFEKENKLAPEVQNMKQISSREPSENSINSIEPFEINFLLHGNAENKGKEIIKLPQQLEFDIFSELSDTRVTGAKPREFRFSVLPMWLKHTGLISNMCSSGYLLLQELIAYDFRYKPEKDKFFFIKHSTRYDTCTDFIAHIAGVKPKTLHKKILPGLKGYVNYRKTDEMIKFQMKWNKLFELYQKYAKDIPFDDGGLMDIPSDFTGILRPTPFHAIHIENGKIKNYENLVATEKKPQQKVPVKKAMEEKSQLAIKLEELGMAEQQIQMCMKKKEATEDVLKYINEMPLYEKDKIGNMAGFIYKLVSDGFKPPEGFITAKVAEGMREKKKAAEEIASLIEAKFRGGEVKYFSPKDGVKYPICVIPNNHTFLYKKNDGIPIAGTFAEWHDIKFFC